MSVFVLFLIRIFRIPTKYGEIFCIECVFRTLPSISYGNFCKKIILQLSTVNYVHKIIHHKCLKQSRKRLCICHIKPTVLLKYTHCNFLRIKDKFLKKAMLVTSEIPFFLKTLEELVFYSKIPLQIKNSKFYEKQKT